MRYRQKKTLTNHLMMIFIIISLISTVVYSSKAIKPIERCVPLTIYNLSSLSKGLIISNFKLLTSCKLKCNPTPSSSTTIYPSTNREFKVCVKEKDTYMILTFEVQYGFRCHFLYQQGAFTRCIAPIKMYIASYVKGGKIIDGKFIPIKYMNVCFSGLTQQKCPQ